MCRDVNACDCTWGCTDTVERSTLKVDSWRKILCSTRELNLHRWHANPMHYQLSYIPTPTCIVSFHLFEVSLLLPLSTVLRIFKNCMRIAYDDCYLKPSLLCLHADAEHLSVFIDGIQSAGWYWLGYSPRYAGLYGSTAFQHGL